MNLIKKYALLAAATFMASSALAEIPSGFTITPGENAEVESIESFTIKGGTLWESFTLITDYIIIDNNNVTVTESHPEGDTWKETLILSLSTPVTSPGVHTVVIPAETFSYDAGFTDKGKKNPEFEFNVIIPGGSSTPDPTPGEGEEVIPVGFTVVPAPGSEVEKIDKLTINYENDKAFSYTLVEGKKILINDQETIVSGSTNTGSDFIEFFTLTLETPVTASGVYNIVIPAETFTYKMFGSGQQKNTEFSFTLTIPGSGEVEPDPEPEPTPEGTVIPEGFTVDPAPDSEVEKIETIVINFEDDTVSKYQLQDGKTILINDEEYEVTASSEMGDEYIYYFTLALKEAITEPGEYNVLIPAETFTYSVFLEGTRKNSVYSFTLTIPESQITDPEPDPDPDPTPEPEGTVIPEGFSVEPADMAIVEVLEVITVTSDSYTNLVFNEDKTILVNGVEYSVTAANTDLSTIVLSFDRPFTVDGDYEIEIPKASFIYENNGEIFDNTLFRFTVTVDSESGVNDIFIQNNDGVEIYTIQGLRIDYSKMEKGKIYIIKKSEKFHKILVK